MKLLITAISCISISSCSAYKAWYGNDLPVMSSIALRAKMDSENVQITTSDLDAPLADNEVHLGALISWSPNYNAAFIGKNGAGCVQPAAYAITKEGGVTVPTEVVSMLLKAESGAGSEGVSANYSEALEKLVTVSDQSTFFSIGSYAICQLSANDLLTQEQSAQLMSSLIIRAATLNGSKGANQNESIEAKITVNGEQSEENVTTPAN